MRYNLIRPNTVYRTVRWREPIVLWLGRITKPATNDGLQFEFAKEHRPLTLVIGHRVACTLCPRLLACRPHGMVGGGGGGGHEQGHPCWRKIPDLVHLCGLSGHLLIQCAALQLPQRLCWGSGTAMAQMQFRVLSGVLVRKVGGERRALGYGERQPFCSYGLWIWQDLVQVVQKRNAECVHRWGQDVETENAAL